jgi:hypothetical protein
MNPVQNFPLHFCTAHFNIPQSRPGLPRCLFRTDFPTNISYASLSSVLHVSPIALLLIRSTHSTYSLVTAHITKQCRALHQSVAHSDSFLALQVVRLKYDNVNFTMRNRSPMYETLILQFVLVINTLKLLRK